MRCEELKCELNAWDTHLSVCMLSIDPWPLVQNCKVKAMRSYFLENTEALNQLVVLYECK